MRFDLGLAEGIHWGTKHKFIHWDIQFPLILSFISLPVKSAEVIC